MATTLVLTGHDLGEHQRRIWSTSSTTWVRIGHDLSPHANCSTSAMGSHRPQLGCTSAMGHLRRRCRSASATLWPTSATAWVHIGHDFGPHIGHGMGTHRPRLWSHSGHDFGPASATTLHTLATIEIRIVHGLFGHGSASATTLDPHWPRLWSSLATTWVNISDAFGRLRARLGSASVTT